MPLKPEAEARLQDFDPVKFKTEILDDLNKTVNGANKTLKTDFQKMLEDTVKELKAAAPGVDPNAPSVDPDKPAATIAELNSKLSLLTREHKTTQETLTAEKTRREQAETNAKEAQRVSAFDSALSGLQFASDKARDLFRRSYLGMIKWDDAGNLIVDTDKGPMDMKGFIQNEYQESTYLQPPLGRGGAGAGSSTRSGTGAPGTTGFVYRDNMTASEINALTPEQKLAFRAQVAESYSEAQMGSR